MKCMYCGSKTEVTNSRRQKRTNHIWRRRFCSQCLNVFTTVEAADLNKSLVVVSGTQLEPFSRDKLFLTIHDSLKHRKLAYNDATALTDTIISRLYPLISKASLQKSDITLVSEEILKRFDKVAAVHYKAFHA